jgi:hypothetical protein
MIPLDLVEAVDGNKVMLSQTSEQARQMWRTINDAAADSIANDSKKVESDSSNQQTDTLSKSRSSGS